MLANSEYSTKEGGEDMNEIQFIKNEAISLSVGDTAQVDCCFCDKQNKLSITRIDEGILYNCWSASCSGKGFIGSLPSCLMEKVSKKVFVPKMYNRPTKAWAGDELKWLCSKYHLKESTVRPLHG